MSIRKEYSYRVEWLNEQGDLHRLDGPAVEWNYGTKEWFINGKRHREDRPAIEFRDGHKSWYLNDIRYSEQEYKKEIIKIRFKRIQNL